MIQDKQDGELRPLSYKYLFLMKNMDQMIIILFPK
jgi:hypothetical protein